jgi:acyl-CoA dehydrogenase
MVRDLSRYALQLAHKPSTTPEQQQRAMAMIRKPAVDAERFRRVWEGEVYALADAYEMAE